jgi:hypothetical protein
MSCGPGSKCLATLIYERYASDVVAGRSSGPVNDRSHMNRDVSAHPLIGSNIRFETPEG